MFIIITFLFNCKLSITLSIDVGAIGGGGGAFFFLRRNDNPSVDEASDDVDPLKLCPGEL